MTPLAEMLPLVLYTLNGADLSAHMLAHEYAQLPTHTLDDMCPDVLLIIYQLKLFSEG